MEYIGDAKYRKSDLEDRCRKVESLCGIPGCRVELCDGQDRYLIGLDRGWCVGYLTCDVLNVLTKNGSLGLTDIRNAGPEDMWVYARSGELVARARQKLANDDLIFDARKFYDAVLVHLL
jgi:hypothetical protein